MKEDALSQFQGGSLMVVALLIFVVCFAGIVLWAFRRSGRRHYERMAALPLDEGDSE